MIRIGLHGSSGKMGRSIEEVITAGLFPDLEISARVRSSSGAGDWEKLFQSDLILEFTSAQGLKGFIEKVQSRGAERCPPVLSGSTGLDQETREDLETLAEKTPFLWSANFSRGVLLLQEALRSLAGSPALQGFEVRIRDLHHAQKKDSPSGTALVLQAALGAHAPIESIREGNIIGRHEIRLQSPRESVEFIHEVTDRKVFAEGALFFGKELIARQSSLPRRLLSLSDLS